MRFVSDLSFAFPTGDVRSLERQDVDDLLEEIEGVPAAPEQPDKMTVNFLGLATPNSFGSLPTPYVEEIRFQERENNFAMRDFLDLFNHRLISFFYRAWERSQPAVRSLHTTKAGPRKSLTTGKRVCWWTISG